ncbi:hypothetical protein ACK1U3_05140 [Pseudomonas promysalinigenes]|uniref:hypothetical protein n=1 Tax=Pseudomonas promysalinigenes TaxID=485898 RepID=UPI0039170FF9
MSHAKDNQIIRYAYRSGLYGRNDQVILTGTPLLETEHQLFGRMTTSLVELVFHVFEHRYQADHGQFGRALGKSTSLIELLLSLSSRPIMSSILARADIVLTADGFKIIELNLGSQIGGMYYASLPRLAGVHQEHDALNGWSKHVLSRLDGRDSMVFTDSVAGAAWMSPYCQQLSRELALDTGVDTPLVDCEAFSYRAGTLYAAGREVNAIYSWLSDHELHAGQARMQPLIQALQAGAVDLLMSPLAPVFADKGVFALLWQLHQQNSLRDDQSAFLKAHVPFTQWLEYADIEWLRSEQQRLVIKPTDGYGGRGVVVGREVSAQAWSTLINERLQQAERARHVVQALALPLPQAVGVGRWDGTSGWADSHVIWGAFAQGGDYLGAYARSKPCTGSLVINQGNGAAVGPVTSE